MNSFQCWQGVDLAGSIISSTAATPNPSGCAILCLKTSGCSVFSQSLSWTCTLLSNPLMSQAAGGGYTGVNQNTAASCLLKSVGGLLPSPANMMCYNDQDVAGTEVRH